MKKKFTTFLTNHLVNSFYSDASRAIATAVAIYMEVLANFPDRNPALLSRVRHSGGTAAFRCVYTRERRKIIRKRNKVSGQSSEIS